MAKRLTPQQQVENFFMHCKMEELVTVVDRVNLIVQTRAGNSPTTLISNGPRKRRGRPPKAAEPGPLVGAEEAATTTLDHDLRCASRAGHVCNCDFRQLQEH